MNTQRDFHHLNNIDGFIEMTRHMNKVIGKVNLEEALDFLLDAAVASEMDGDDLNHAYTLTSHYFMRNAFAGYAQLDGLVNEFLVLIHLNGVRAVVDWEPKTQIVA